MNNNLLNLNLKLTINQMLISNLHIGHSRKFLNSRVKPFLLGYRNNIAVLNISNTPVQLKIFINLLINLISLRHKVLIVKDSDLYNFRELLNLKNLYYSDKKWIGGTLTNYKKVRFSSKFQAGNSYTNGLQSMSYMPSLVFFFDIDLSKWAALEAVNLNIPIGSLIDSSTNLSSFINYHIVGNNKSFEALYLYMTLLKNAVIKGQQKELLKILRIL